MLGTCDVVLFEKRTFYEKYSNKLSMKALVEKDILIKNKKKR